MLFLIAVPILFIVLGLPGIFGLFFVPLAPSSAVEGKLSVLLSSVTSLLIMGPRFCDCVPEMFGGSNTPGVGSASLRAVLASSRGFDFSGVGVGSSVESTIGRKAGAGLSGTVSSSTEARGRDSEESVIWLHIRDLRSASRRMRL